MDVYTAVVATIASGLAWEFGKRWTSTRATEHQSNAEAVARLARQVDHAIEEGAELRKRVAEQLEVYERARANMTEEMRKTVGTFDGRVSQIEATILARKPADWRR